MTEQRNPFDAIPEAYDAWFDAPEGRIIFQQEVACLKVLMARSAPGRWLEVGVGTGRFAMEMSVPEGVEPSAPMRALAARRGVRTYDAAAEQLPFADGVMDGVLMTTTVSFLKDPAQAFREAQRVLKDGGSFVVGLIPADSPWARNYTRKAEEGHPVYAAARFRTVEEAVHLAALAGFMFREACSCLLAPPEAVDPEEEPQPGVIAGAGFAGLAFTKPAAHPTD
jgi:ubiquinone/menaquinone biosynthesis C-methylase UbiE